MNIQDHNLKSLSAPKSRQDAILLLQLACECMDTINAELAAMNTRAEHASLKAA